MRESSFEDHDLDSDSTIILPSNFYKSIEQPEQESEGEFSFFDRIPLANKTPEEVELLKLALNKKPAHSANTQSAFCPRCKSNDLARIRRSIFQRIFFKDKIKLSCNDCGKRFITCSSIIQMILY